MRLISIVLASLSLISCATSAPAPLSPGLQALSEARLAEPFRTNLMSGCVQTGVPLTHCRCMEISFVKRGWGPAQLADEANRAEFHAMEKRCLNAVKDVLMKEIKDAAEGALQEGPQA